MKKLRNVFSIILVATLVFVLTACGGKSSNVTEDPNESYTGEGKTTGGIPTDEELAARESEADFYENSSDTWDGEEDHTINPDPEPGESNGSKPDPSYVDMDPQPISDTYLPAENFYTSSDYFDLEEYLYMNGASKVLIGTLDEEGEFKEDVNDQTIYEAWLGDWLITIIAPNSISFDHINSGASDKKYYPNYYVVLTESVNNWAPVDINSHGAQLTENTIAALDHLVKIFKEHPESDDPSPYNEKSDIFMIKRHS